MKPQVFTRSKKVWKDENEARADVIEKQELSEKGQARMKAAHTDAKYVWEMTPLAEGISDLALNQKTYAKDKHSESEAAHAAMADLDTFEGNLAPDHTETHYRFSKVRG